MGEGRSWRGRGEPERAVAAFREALDLWAGEAYAEFVDEEWVAPEAHRLSELRAATEGHLLDADRADVVRSFDATQRRVAALHHEAIVPIDDHWREAGGAYIVMRRMRGGTLRDRLDGGGMPWCYAAGQAGPRGGDALTVRIASDMHTVAGSTANDTHPCPGELGLNLPSRAVRSDPDGPRRRDRPRRPPPVGPWTI